MVRILAMAVLLTVFFAGLCFAQQDMQTQFTPRKVQVDSDYDGKIDRIETYDQTGQVQKVEADTNSNGKMDEWVTYKNGKPIKKEKDQNEDGKVDVWVDY